MRATVLAKQTAAQVVHTIANKAADTVSADYNRLVPRNIQVRRTGEREWERDDTGSFRLIVPRDAVVAFSSERTLDGAITHDRQVFKIRDDAQDARVLVAAKTKVPIADLGALGRVLTEPWLSRFQIDYPKARRRRSKTRPRA